jgi:hypothetical protein
METRMTLEQLEKMKTHEIADLLANVVLLLRRLPDVPCGQLIQQMSGSEHRDNHIEAVPELVLAPLPALTRDELTKKKVAELKILAKEFNVFFSASAKKDDLINKILARSLNGHSEQRAILDM